jgi:peroxiredoxin
MTLTRAIKSSIASIAVAIGASYAAAPLPGADAPDFVLKSVLGNNLRLSEYRGEVVMLAFWATWCGDCRAQLDTLAEAHALYRDAGLALLAVSLDQDRRTAQKAVEAMDVSYPVLHDAGGEVGRLYDVETLPTLVLIDRDGIVREVYPGHRRSEKQRYVDKVQELLREF